MVIDVDAAREEALAQGLLRRDGIAVDDLEDGGLPESFHEYATDCIVFRSPGAASSEKWDLATHPARHPQLPY